MSKTTKSASKSLSRSKSKSKSKSRSRSLSRSSSRSRSRYRKYRDSARSRSLSRSRSHSPSHNRERNYPREYQNNRTEFRGYHRGFRRPYYYRGRGRGYFPRGRYQRGRVGGYNNNNNYRPNNWQNYRQYPHQQQQQHHTHSPRRGRSRTPKKHSGSPHSNSHHSDRSSSPRSKRSRHSSCSSHSSPKHKSASGSAKQNTKDVKEERSASKEVQKVGEVEGGGGGGGDDGGGDGEVMEISGSSGGAEEGTGGNKGGGNWQDVADYSTSPKRVSPQVRSAVIVSQATPTTSPSPNHSNAAGNGVVSQQTVGDSPSTKSPSLKSPTPVFSGFGFFSKEDNLADKEAISTAFKKFLEEHKSKKRQSAWENGREVESNGVDMEQQKKGNAKSPEGIFDKVSGYRVPKGTDSTMVEKEKYKYKDNCDGSMSLNSFMHTSPFLYGDDGEEEKQVRLSKPRPKVRRQDWDIVNEDPKPKSKVALSARELFEERFGKWEDLAYLKVVKDNDVEAMAEEIYRGQRQEKAVALAAALAKREIVGMFSGSSPERSSKARRKEKAQISSPSPPPRRNSDMEMLMVRGENSPPRTCGKKREFNVRLDSLRDVMASSSEVLASERRLSRDLVHPSKKEQEFRSIFQHVQVQTTQLPTCPSELFAQHIVTIVHHVKAQHFQSSEMTLNERFAMYQRTAAEIQTMKPRKSPEIHRRIDVSPSAFKKHSHLFEGMKISGDGSYNKDEGKKGKVDSKDLRLDIERRKKCSAREGNYKCDGERDSGDSPETSRERSADVSSKHHKKSKKGKKRHSRSSSSSSSCESHRGGDHPQEEPELKEEGFNKARLGPRDYVDPLERGRPHGGFQFRIRGRGWNRGNYQGSSTNGNPLNMPMHLKNEDWDPEYTPKSRKYYLHDDRDRETESSWVDNRGRGRGNFLRGRGRVIIRRGNVGAINNNSPKWTHDKCRGNGEERDTQEEDPEQDHKDTGKDGDMNMTEQ